MSGSKEFVLHLTEFFLAIRRYVRCPDPTLRPSSMGRSRSDVTSVVYGALQVRRYVRRPWDAPDPKLRPLSRSDVTFVVDSGTNSPMKTVVDGALHPTNSPMKTVVDGALTHSPMKASSRGRSYQFLHKSAVDGALHAPTNSLIKASSMGRFMAGTVLVSRFSL